MSAARVLATAEAAGIRFSVTVGGDVRMVAKQPPPPGLVVELRRYKDDVALLLATRDGYLSRLAGRRRQAIREGREVWTRSDALAQMVAQGIDPGRDAGGTGQRRMTSWGDASLTPMQGDWCCNCGRFDRQGGRWWREAITPTGWRCATCHPPPSSMAVVTVSI
jgi:hypothetical protein